MPNEIHQGQRRRFRRSDCATTARSARVTKDFDVKPDHLPASADRHPTGENIGELEGLRGLLALWVVIYHVGSISELRLPAPLAAMTDGAHAVDVFVILSGFVIASLRAKRPESYAVFLARRWLRLFPAYAVCVAVAILLAEARIMPKRYSSDDFGWLLAAHAAMLQGVVPEAVLPSASAAFLNPTWSISLEWQFYLIAPLFVGALSRSAGSFLVTSLLVAAAFKLAPVVDEGLGGMTGAFLLQKLPLFWIGVGSFLLYRWAIDNRDAPASAAAGAIVLAVAACVFALAIPVGRFLGLAIWSVAFAAVTSARTNSSASWAIWPSRLLSAKIIVGLGSISYPLYLCHEPIIWAARKYILQLLPNANAYLFAGAIACVAIPASILVATLIHRGLEKPVIIWGRMLARSAGARKASSLQL